MPLYNPSSGSSGSTANLGHLPVPSDRGFTTWTVDPALTSGGTTIGAGVVCFVKIKLPSTATITNISVYLTAGGVTLTSGQCFAALYNSAGTKVDATAEQSANWVSSGLKTMALAGGSQSLTAGDYYVAFFYNGTTSPQWARYTGSASPANLALTGTNPSGFAAGSWGSSITAVPASMGAQSSSGSIWWAALS